MASIVAVLHSEVHERARQAKQTSKESSLAFVSHFVTAPVILVPFYCLLVSARPVTAVPTRRMIERKLNTRRDLFSHS